MSESVSILFAGGATGGHLFPGIAVAESLTRMSKVSGLGCRVGFVGQGTCLERDETRVRGYEYYAVPSVSTLDVGRRPLRSLGVAWRSYCLARRIVRRFEPTVVIGLGGFASVPAVVAANRMRVPVMLLEQNVIPGRATRWLSRRAARVCVAFAETRLALARPDACRLTGNPVRGAGAGMVFDASDRKRLLVVLGGSQGSRSLNRAVPEALGRIGVSGGGWRVVHQCGDHDPRLVEAAYREQGWEARVEQFLECPPTLLASSDLVVARAGATTLAEMACAGVAGVLVPYPFASDDHQRANAAWYVERGAARMVEEAEVGAEWVGRLAGELGLLLDSESKRLEMSAEMGRLARPNAAEEVVGVMAELAGESLNKWVSNPGVVGRMVDRAA